MPVPSFLSSIADKAQSAINSSPLAGHLGTAPSNDTGAQGTSKSHTLESIQHQFRSIQQQYTYG